MFKRILFLFSIISVVLLLNTATVFAVDVQPGLVCTPGTDTCCTCQNNGCNPCVNDGAHACQPIFNPDGTPVFTGNTQNQLYLCRESSVGKAFGKIAPPGPLAGFLQNNPTGGGAISQFLSNGITLIYSIAGIVLVFILLWGAFDWMISGGDKEKLSSAQNRIISAIVGIILFAVAFAVIRVLGTFTGFKFFN